MPKRSKENFSEKKVSIGKKKKKKCLETDFTHDSKVAKNAKDKNIKRKIGSKSYNKAITKPFSETVVTKSQCLASWFDDVDHAAMLDDNEKTQNSCPESEVGSDSKRVHINVVDDRPKEASSNLPSNDTTPVVIALDCEMVGVGELGKKSILARVSIVDEQGNCIYDKYVKPSEEVTDYRTNFSGIRPKDIWKGEDYDKVTKEVKELVKGKRLVGHALWHDLRVLGFSHPKKHMRDTCRYHQFRKLAVGSSPSLKFLCSNLLSKTIQTGSHNSVEDARAALELYTKYKDQWESDSSFNRLKKQRKAEAIQRARKMDV